MTTQEPTEKLIAAEDDAEVSDALEILFDGRVEELVPPEELGEFHDFLREESILRRRFAISFRLDCGCLAWIGYSLSNLVTYDEGIEFTAKPTQSFIPDHEADVEHPAGPTEDPPEEFEDWPIWPFEIYQDEADDEEEASLSEAAGLDSTLGELAGDEDDLASIRETASHEDPMATDQLDR
jgi:hypothetical protein